MPVAVVLAGMAALAVLMVAASLMGNQERAAELARQIDALWEKFVTFLEGDPVPEEAQKQKSEYDKLMERLGVKPKKDPDPDPKPYPPPVIPGNRGPDQYERDRNKREECEKKKEKYRWGTHSEVKEKTEEIGGIPEQSHHPRQDAYFTSGRGYGLTNICGGYHTDDAPALPVVGGSRWPGSPHDRINNDQSAAAGQYRRRYVGPPPGPRPTLSEVTNDGMQSIAKNTPMGSDPVALACLLEYINDYFRRTCPSLTPQSPLKIQSMQPADPGP